MVPMHLVKQRRHLLADQYGEDEEEDGVLVNSSRGMALSNGVEKGKSGRDPLRISPLEIDLPADDDSVTNDNQIRNQVHIRNNEAKQDRRLSEDLQLLRQHEKASNHSQGLSDGTVKRRSSDTVTDGNALARKSLHDHIRQLQEKRAAAETDASLSQASNHGNQGRHVQTIDTNALRAQIENQVCLLTSQQLVGAMPSVLQDARVMNLPQVSQALQVSLAGVDGSAPNGDGASAAALLNQSQLAALQAHALGSPTGITSRDLAMFQQAHLFSSALQTLSQLTGDGPIQSQSVAQILPAPDAASQLDPSNRANFQCRTCGKQMASQQGLLIHYRTHTGEKPHVCGFCGKGLSTSQGLQVHVRTHTGEKPFMCLFCGKGFNDKSNMKRHIKQCNTYGQRINALT